MAITVFVVDDHAMVRTALIQLLQLEEGIEVVGEGDGSGDTLGAIRKLRPQVVIVDLEMPKQRGTDLISAIKAADRNIRVLVCTMHAAYAHVAEALRCGADGYILKSSPSTLLTEGIRRLASGQGHIDPALQSDVIRLLQVPEQRGANSELSAREIEALRFASEGLSNEEIATRTAQSMETVKLRLRRAFQKLGAVDRASAVAIALRRNLIH